MLMIGGEFDLSIGSMIGAAGVVIAIPAVQWGWPLWLCILLAFAIACLVGYINGSIVVRTGLPSFIVTLAGLFILRGADHRLHPLDHRPHPGLGPQDAGGAGLAGAALRRRGRPAR